MHELMIHAFDWSHAQAHKLVRDVPCERWAEMPYEGAKHAAWTVPHLCFGSAFAVGLLSPGEDDVTSVTGVPASWRDVVGLDSTPAPDRALYPTKDEALRVFDTVHNAAVERLEQADDALLAAEFPIEDLRATWPTVRHAINFLFTQHDTYHVGQLQQWRRAIGMGPAA